MVDSKTGNVEGDKLLPSFGVEGGYTLTGPHSARLKDLETRLVRNNTLPAVQEEGNEDVEKEHDFNIAAKPLRRPTAQRASNVKVALG